MGLEERNGGAARVHGADPGSRGRWHRPKRPGSIPTISTLLAFCQAKTEATVNNLHYRQNDGAGAGQSLQTGCNGCPVVSACGGSIDI